MAVSNFEQVMNNLGYEFAGQEDSNIRFEKHTKFATLSILFNLKKKYISAIMIPSSLILYHNDLTAMVRDFTKLQEDAKYLAQLSHYSLLNEN